MVGADGCPTGWILAVLNGDRLALDFAETFAEAIATYDSAEVFAIDIPIGLGSGSRPADMQARSYVGPRRSSVFPAPPELILGASSYQEALRAAQAETGKGISSQVWALVPKIREVAALTSDARIHEVHPEVTFRALAGEPLEASKKTSNGLEQRRSLLAGVGLEPPPDPGEAGNRGALDDIVDAIAAVWTARRIATGEANRFPEIGAERAPVIWY